MTLKYASSIPGQGNYLKFFKLLIHWRGSIYKLVWFDLAMYLVVYYAISLIYRVILPIVDVERAMQNRTLRATRFEDFILYVGAMKSKSIPVTFLLGFFVSQVLSRWWRMFNCIPMMNYPAFNLNSLILTSNNPDVARRIRLTAMRYLNLAWILALRQLSSIIKDRFQLKNLEIYMNRPYERVFAELDVLNHDPNIKKHFPVMVTQSEIKAFQEISKLSMDSENYVLDWCVPLQWCVRLLKKAVKHGFVENERHYLSLVAMVGQFSEVALSTLGLLQIQSSSGVQPSSHYCVIQLRADVCLRQSISQQKDSQRQKLWQPISFRLLCTGVRNFGVHFCHGLAESGFGFIESFGQR